MNSQTNGQEDCNHPYGNGMFCHRSRQQSSPPLSCCCCGNRGRCWWASDLAAAAEASSPLESRDEGSHVTKLRRGMEEGGKRSFRGGGKGKRREEDGEKRSSAEGTMSGGKEQGGKTKEGVGIMWPDANGRPGGQVPNAIESTSDVSYGSKRGILIVAFSVYFK